MQIRYATTEDTKELNLFYTRMNEIINTRTNKYNPENEVFPSVTMVKNSIENKEQFVGVEDGQIVAACIMNHQCDDAYMNVKWQIELDKNEFWVLHALRVAPEYEGRGFAKQMIGYVISIAEQKNLKAIRLDVLDGYSVDKIYTQFGFEHIDTISIFYEDIGYSTRFRLFEKIL